MSQLATPTAPPAAPAPIPQPSGTESQQNASSRSKWIVAVRGAIPTWIVFAVLFSLAAYGHETGWTLPKFSSLTGAEPMPPAAWCEAHGVPDAECVECHKNLLPPGKDYGWCREHRVHQCPWHHPDVAQLDAPPKVTDEDLQRINQAIALTSRPLNNSVCKNYLRRIQFASAEAAEKAGIDVAAAVEGPIAETISATGQLVYDPTRVLHVASPLPGKVSLVFKSLGDRVRSGDVLALIDSAAVGNAKADLLQALAQVGVRQLSLQRKQASAGSIPARELLEARAALREAEVRLLAARQTLVNLGLDVDVDELQRLDEAAQNARLRTLGLSDEFELSSLPREQNGNLLPLRSTIDGIITSIDLVPGEIVDSEKELYVVADASRLWLMLDVRAEEGRFIRPGQLVSFRADNGAAPIAGSVAWISPAVDEKTRTVRVRADVDNGEERLRSHLFGVGTILLRQDSRAVLVPNEAVQTEGCCRVVFVRDKAYLKEGTPKVFHVREVQVGARNEDGTELLAGLLPGEVVATNGSGILRAQLLRNNLGAG